MNSRVIMPMMLEDPTIATLLKQRVNPILIQAHLGLKRKKITKTLFKNYSKKYRNITKKTICIWQKVRRKK